MTLLSELKSAIEPLVPVETGVFSDTAPDRYVVLTPLADTFVLHADNEPQIDVQAVRISLYDKGNYIKMKNQIVCAVLAAEMTITGRWYIGHESTTGSTTTPLMWRKTTKWRNACVWSKAIVGDISSTRPKLLTQFPRLRRNFKYGNNRS